MLVGNEETTDTPTENMGLGEPCTLIETHQKSGSSVYYIQLTGEAGYCIQLMEEVGWSLKGARLRDHSCRLHL